MAFTYTVTITHYNTPSLLERMLKSIPERDDIQVIVVDDASHEKAKDAIAQLYHKNLQVIYTPENHGTGYERNVGLDHAQGKWLIACDCDDLFAEGAFDVLDKYKDSDYDYICYCVTCLDEKLVPTGRHLRSDDAVRNYIKEKTKTSIKYFKFWNTEPWNKMVSLDFIKRNGIKWEECRINVDVYYSFQLALLAKKYMAIPDELYHFVGDNNSITRKKRSIEREFGFYLAQQKRNGFFKLLGYWYPFSRPDWLYLFYLLKKRGIKETVVFYNYRKKHWHEVVDARKKFVHLLEGIEKNKLLDC
ncbi:MAG: glycosyltransferase [Bacteroidaceae bacterium]|nr:glycosyltransferase [Bacteroidaceae bacterium]